LPQATLEQFQAFRDERPKEEKWELIDGVPEMMPPPTLKHQRICRNLETLINSRLAIARPEWLADREIGLLDPKDDRFNPEPDVTVIDAVIGNDQIYAEQFYFVCEVLSGSDKPIVLQLKLAYYQKHPSNLGVLFVRQDSVSAKLYARDGDAWVERRLVDAGGPVDLPGIGIIGRLGDLYRTTPLDPFV
jgi:Uma2 family endonuclease